MFTHDMAKNFRVIFKFFPHPIRSPVLARCAKGLDLVVEVLNIVVISSMHWSCITGIQEIGRYHTVYLMCHFFLCSHQKVLSIFPLFFILGLFQFWSME